MPESPKMPKKASPKSAPAQGAKSPKQQGKKQPAKSATPVEGTKSPRQTIKINTKGNNTPVEGAKSPRQTIKITAKDWAAFEKHATNPSTQAEAAAPIGEAESPKRASKKKRQAPSENSLRPSKRAKTTSPVEGAASPKQSSKRKRQAASDTSMRPSKRAKPTAPVDGPSVSEGYDATLLRAERNKQTALNGLSRQQEPTEPTEQEHGRGKRRTANPKFRRAGENLVRDGDNSNSNSNPKSSRSRSRDQQPSQDGDIPGPTRAKGSADIAPAQPKGKEPVRDDDPIITAQETAEVRMARLKDKEIDAVMGLIMLAGALPQAPAAPPPPAAAEVPREDGMSMLLRAARFLDDKTQETDHGSDSEKTLV